LSSLSHLTSSTPTKSNLYYSKSLNAAVSEPALYRLLIFQVPNLVSFSTAQFVPEDRASPRIILGLCRNKIRFHNEELFAPRPNPKQEDHSLSAVCDCLFNIFAVIHHIGDRSPNRNLRTRHSVVTGTHISRTFVWHHTQYSLCFIKESGN
jgi:hypothetical protein